MIILVGIGYFMAGAVVGIVMMSLCVASHNSSLELENRQKAGAGGVDTVVGLIKTSERRQSIRSVRGGVEHGSRIIKAGIYSLYHNGSRIIGSRYSLV